MRRDYPEWARKTEQAIIDRLAVSPMSSAQIRDYVNDHRPQAIRKLLDGMSQAGAVSCVGRSTQAKWVVTGSEAQSRLMDERAERIRARKAEYAKKRREPADCVAQTAVTTLTVEQIRAARSVFEIA